MSFNLSEKRKWYDEKIIYYYPEENVREFIQKLKEEIKQWEATIEKKKTNRALSQKDMGWNNAISGFIENIEKLAGSDLI